MRYSAFISYTYRDRKTAVWLHRVLESYRIPKRLRGRDSPFGILGVRMQPVFRDREELAASSDLAEAVREALTESATLVVICTPDGARSRWVNEEIRTFTALGRRDRIRCLIAAGEPHAADPAKECLPPALFENGGSEPLAADLRPDQDGYAGARLKLIAGVLDVPYDELRRREAQRRQRRLAIVAGVASALVLVLTALTVFAFVSRSEAVHQRDVARRRTVAAERTTAFVQSMFAVADPDEAHGSTVTAKEIVDRGAERIRHELADEPAVRAQLSTTLAEVYGSLGLYTRAGDIARWGLSIRHDDSDVRAHQIGIFGETRAHLGDDGHAVPAFERVLALCRTARDGCSGGLVAQTYTDLGEAAFRAGNDTAAITWGLRGLKADLHEGGPINRFVARDLEDIAKVTSDIGNPALARKLLERALAIRLRTDGPNSRGVSDEFNELGAVAYALGDRAGAERFFRARLGVDERVLGPNHPDVAVTLNNLGRMMIERRAFVGAIPLLRRAWTIDLASHGPDWEDNAFALSNLALAYAESGDGRQAAPLFERALIVAQMHGHRTIAPIMTDLAELECAEGRTSAGLARLDAARPIMARTYRDTAWRTAWVDNVRGGCLLAAGERGKARPLLAVSTPVILAKWPANTMYGHDAARRLAAARSPALSTLKPIGR